MIRPALPSVALLLLVLLAACSGAGTDDAPGEDAGRTASADSTDDSPAEELAADDARPPAAGVSGGRESVRETLVVVQPLVTGPIRDEIVVSSRIESRYSVAVFPKLSNLPIVEVVVEVADEVAAGDVLMRLYDDDLRLALRQAQASLDQALNEAERAALRLAEEAARVVRTERSATKTREDYERLAALLADGLVNGLEVEDARLLAETSADDLELARFAHAGAELELAQARLRVQAAELDVSGAESDLSHTTVRAPLTGVVAERSVEVGELSSLSAPAFRIVDLGRPVLNLRVPQDALPRLTAGQQVEARAVTDPGVRFRGVVRTVNPVLDASTGTVHVVVDLEPGAGVVPGLFCEARIVTAAREQALLVDKRAVRYDDERPVFFALAEDERSVRRVPFVAGASTPTSIEVLSDEEGRAVDTSLRVVVVGNESLKEGSRVRVREEPY